MSVLLILIAVMFASASTVAAAEASQQTTVDANGSIAQVNQTQALEAPGNTTYFWETTAQGEPINSTLLEVDTNGTGAAAEVCLKQPGSTTCKPVENSSTVTLSLSLSTADEPRQFSVTLRNSTSGENLDRVTGTYHQIARTGDLDGDGLNNSAEVTAGSNLTNGDTDDDGLGDGEEVTEYGASPLVADTDGDGLTDKDEIGIGSDPTAVDTDKDGLDDAREQELGTNTSSADTDGDGLTDKIERQLGTNPILVDSDGDGLSDGDELEARSDPLERDTDDDGLTDSEEQDAGTSPINADTDGDGLSDSEELAAGIDPTNADTDGDGLADSEEQDAGSDPTNADTDGDGLADSKELAEGTDPTVADTDSDGIPDGREVNELATSPISKDTDGDLMDDQLETTIGTNPTSQLTPAWLSSGFFGFIIGILFTTIRSGRAITIIERIRAFEDRLVRSERDTIDITAETEESSGPADDGGLSETDLYPAEGTTAAQTFEADSAEAAYANAETALLSDKEVVNQMLRAEGGRMKQSEIVTTTDWSKAKVSRLLSRLADEDEITKVRLGRENLICLESAEPEALRQSTGRRERTSLASRNTTC